MTAYQRKAISLATYFPTSVSQNFGYVSTDWTVTNTGYLRITMPWDKLAPGGPNNPASDPSQLPGAPAGFRVMDYVAAMDAQITLANQMGIGVILVFDCFPQWANGTSDHLVPPADVSPGSAWWLYLGWIIQRYSVLTPGTHPYASVIEICNEPNFAWNGIADSDRYLWAGRMMLSAQTYMNAGYTSPLLGGPALADRQTTDPTDSITFTNALCTYLRSSGFPAFNGSAVPYWVWTQHNYGDLENGTAAGGYERAQAIRSRLKAYGWAAWPYGDPSNPYVFLTEGGVRLGKVGSPYNADPPACAARTGQVYNRVHNDLLAGGQGLAMFTNFLDITVAQANANCGLRDAAGPAYAPRPLYTTWAGLAAP